MPADRILLDYEKISGKFYRDEILESDRRFTDVYMAWERFVRNGASTTGQADLNGYVDTHDVIQVATLYVNDSMRKKLADGPTRRHSMYKLFPRNGTYRLVVLEKKKVESVNI
jgi:hypothetical protein